MRKVLVLAFFVFLALFINKAAFAEATIEKLEDKIARMEARIQELENRLAIYEDAGEGHRSGNKKAVEKAEAVSESENEEAHAEAVSFLEGLEIRAGATFIYQFTENANVNAPSGDDKDASDVSYSVDLEFENKFEDYGTAFLHLETGDGAGAEDELEVFSNVNRDADDSDNSVSVTEAWYEHYFKLLPLTLTVGKIDATAYIDGNEYANDECSQFLGRIFRNSPVIEFPDDNTAGIRALVEPVEFLEIELAAMDANDDWEDIFDNIFLVGQLNLKPGVFNRPGNYRIYGWINDKDHREWNNDLETEEENYGFGVSIDQEITDIVGAFARYGWQDPEVYAEDSDFSLEQSWSAGIQFTGSPWLRDEDIFAVAFGQVIPSDDYQQANGLKAKTESHLEAYYNFKFNEHLSISPDLQLIWRPYGGDAAGDDGTIVIGGLRGQLDF